MLIVNIVLRVTGADMRCVLPPVMCCIVAFVSRFVGSNAELWLASWSETRMFASGLLPCYTGAKQDSLSDLYLTAVERKTAQILDDAKHPLFSQFQKLRSGRRIKMPIARKNVYKKSFIPSAISVLNSRAT